MNQILQKINHTNVSSDERQFCIVTEDDEVLEKELTLSEAEHRLPSFLDEGCDCYIAEHGDYVH